MIIKLGVIGYPLGHTLSPVFQQAALDHLKIIGQFKAIPITPEELPKFIRTMDKNNIKAVCVTIPHKESVLDLIDEIDPEALKIGAVNWIVNNEGNLKGFNTDYKGFLKSLEFETGFSPYKKTATIFGSGGSCKAVSHALNLAGLSKLFIINRTKKKAENIANDLKSENLDIIPLDFKDSIINNVLLESELIINSTSLGMSGGPEPNNDLINNYDINPGTIGYDLVYSPKETPFLKKIIDKKGIPASGLSMLVFQGIEGFKLSTGQDAPEKLMLDITNSISL